MIKQFIRRKKANPKELFDTKSYADFSEEEKSLYKEIQPFTMTSPERVKALLDSLKYIAKHKIVGDIVECGVWKGGSAMAILKQLAMYNEYRNLWLYDTFQGMSEPTDNDVDMRGDSAKEKLLYEKKEESWVWAYSAIEEVKKNVFSVSYPKERIKFVIGKVEDTLISGDLPEKISLLRLDTDWYESTKVELEVLYPRVVEGGVIIIDDYGHWQGCKLAVDEYLEKNSIKVLLNRIDYTGRLIVKNHTP